MSHERQTQVSWMATTSRRRKHGIRILPWKKITHKYSAIIKMYLVGGAFRFVTDFHLFCRKPTNKNFEWMLWSRYYNEPSLWLPSSCTEANCLVTCDCHFLPGNVLQRSTWWFSAQGQRRWTGNKRLSTENLSFFTHHQFSVIFSKFTDDGQRWRGGGGAA